MILAVVLAALITGAGLWLYAPDASRASLERKYAVSPSQFIDVAGLRIHLRDTGARGAPPIIMLHGFGANLFTWEEWAQALSPQFRVVRFDLPGFGLTGADPSNDYSDRRSLEILSALMDRLEIPRASLIGNSMGGRIAWEFAAAHPERVDRLVLISPDGFASPGVEYGRRNDPPFTLRLLPYILPTVMLRMSLAPAYADAKKLSAAVVTQYRDMMLAPGVREAIVARAGQAMLTDPVPILRTIRAPTLLLWGEKDRMIPFSNAQDYLAAIPDVRLVALAGGGHLPQEEDPETSLIPVRAFLEGSRPGN